MLRHLKVTEVQEWKDGELWMMMEHADPRDPANWIDDPCTFCGGESIPSVCPGDGRLHHHGAIHPPPDSGVSGYWFLCNNPDCVELALAAWASVRVRS
jgi:hypothetical protein